MKVVRVSIRTALDILKFANTASCLAFHELNGSFSSCSDNFLFTCSNFFIERSEPYLKNIFTKCQSNHDVFKCA